MMLILSLVGLLAAQDTINIGGQGPPLVAQTRPLVKEINPAILPKLAIATCPEFPGYVLSVSNTRGRRPGNGGIRNGDTVTVTGKGFGAPGDYSMLTIWQGPPPFPVGSLGYTIQRVSWTDTKIVGQVRIVRTTRYLWDSSNTAYLEITRTKDRKPVRCGVKGLRFSRFPEG